MSHESNRVTTKLFVSKLPTTVRKIDLQNLCEKYGKVVECDFVNKYAFVHFSTPEEAAEAVKNLDNTIFHGSRITVQFSNSPVRTKPGMGQSSACYRCGKYGHWLKDCPEAPQKVTTKLFVSKLPSTVRKNDLMNLCKNYGRVVECDFVNKYAFVHFSTPEEAAEAVKNLDNTIFHGSRITVQFSNSPVRTKPGMGQSSACYRCGKHGHWSRDCVMMSQNQSNTNMSRSTDPGSYEGYIQSPYTQDPFTQNPYTPDLFTPNPYIHDTYTQDLYAQDSHGHLTSVHIDRCRGATRYDPYTRHLSLSAPQAGSSVAINNMSTSDDPYTQHLSASGPQPAPSLAVNSTMTSADPYTRQHLSLLAPQPAPSLALNNVSTTSDDLYTQHLSFSTPEPTSSLTINSMSTSDDPYTRPPPEYYHIPIIQSTRPAR